MPTVVTGSNLIPKVFWMLMLLVSVTSQPTVMNLPGSTSSLRISNRTLPKPFKQTHSFIGKRREPTVMKFTQSTRI